MLRMGIEVGAGLPFGAPGRLQVTLRMPLSSPPLWAFLASAIFLLLRRNLPGCWMGAPAATVLAKSDGFFPVATPAPRLRPGRGLGALWAAADRWLVSLQLNSGLCVLTAADTLLSWSEMSQQSQVCTCGGWMWPRLNGAGGPHGTEWVRGLHILPLFRTWCPYTDVDECTLFNSQVCKGGVCVNKIPGYSCYCPNGYYYETQHLECIGEHCLPPAPEALVARD